MTTGLRKLSDPDDGSEHQALADAANELLEAAEEKGFVIFRHYTPDCLRELARWIRAGRLS
jgi:hypothetical protein